MLNLDDDVKRSESDGLRCQDVRDLLPDYITAREIGEPLASSTAAIHAHIEGCGDCKAELEELSAMTAEVYAGQLDAAPVYPVPDLSFLKRSQPPATPSRIWQFDERLRRLVIQLSEPFLNALRQPAMVGALRGDLLYNIGVETGLSPDLAVRIDVFTEDATRGLGYIQICVETSDGDPLDQPEHRVMLRTDLHQWPAVTDESGCAGVSSVPLGELATMRIEIDMGVNPPAQPA